jgi:hypothetical protein
MNKPVREHIEIIKTTITRLEGEMEKLTDPIELMKTEADLRSLRLALMHYELALQIEHEVIENRSARGVKGFVAKQNN